MSEASAEGRARITVVADRCVGGGQCVLAAPAYFDQDDAGVVVLLHDAPGQNDEEAVEEAARLCPAQAITLQRS